MGRVQTDAHRREGQVKLAGGRDDVERSWSERGRGRQDRRAIPPACTLLASGTPRARAQVSETAVVETARSFPGGPRRSLLGRRSERAVEAHALVRVRRMPLWQSSLSALVGLVFVLGVAVGEMAIGGSLIHAFIDPARRFDVFSALHDQLVMGCLMGVSLLWLLPPHPWAKRLVEATDRAGPADSAGKAGVGVPVRVRTRPLPQGRRPSYRPGESRGAGG